MLAEFPRPGIAACCNGLACDSIANGDSTARLFGMSPSGWGMCRLPFEGGMMGSGGLADKGDGTEVDDNAKSDDGLSSKEGTEDDGDGEGAE